MNANPLQTVSWDSTAAHSGPSQRVNAERKPELRELLSSRFDLIKRGVSVFQSPFVNSTPNHLHVAEELSLLDATPQCSLVIS